ncbi:Acetoacetyl-CoA synthetase [Caballeronia glathei]|uniref:Acetoacetyl-CoA synthase n=1 Tax=Caballeronia glathei TaxID=60547 RepID=A0A069PJ94_9BURK|nr:acetoacetate--CoA ligase [Caballeronia glathei]KDR40447.1 acetoacetyl-CoA synthase [Caballeronia glathei]CDY76997.1 Acetoacetyl-CoA synthetase [Caballeronia glathei]
MNRDNIFGENARMYAREPLFQNPPERIAQSRMSRFAAALEDYTGERFADYPALHAYSVREYRRFWQCFLHWTEGMEWSGSAEPACVGDICESARFFPNVALNYADSLLGREIAPDDAPALTACYADGQRETITRGDLRGRVARLAHSLSELGLRPGDRVVAMMRNDAQAIITALAVTALGATLSTAAPETGVQAILDRFAPLEPKMMFAHTTQRSFDTSGSIAAHVAAVAAALPTLTDIICLDDTPLPSTVKQQGHLVRDLIVRGDAAQFVWRFFPFNHPLFIMFSSGTTGKPKCIVHGAGGTLLEHLKEHQLHSDLGPGDKLYFHTSCSWMMWNWQLSALAAGVEIVTYDGPVTEVDTLWRLVADERVTVFGTSPAYLKMSEDAALEPGKQFDLTALRAMMSTGAVLYDSQFEWVCRQVKLLQLQSISGGTDIIGCFVLGNPNLPVYAGEAQCRSLGLDVQAWEQGAQTSMTGELVCANPFPSRPLGFFGDTNGSRFHAAYFKENPGVWTHGDIIEFSAQGSARLHGRSDGVLNVRGINVSPGEIYRILSGVEEIHQAMVVPQAADTASGRGQRVVLLLVLRRGQKLNGALASRVRRDLMRQGSSALVPDVIVEVGALPFTHNGKASEAAARDAVNGLPVRNLSSLANPASVEGISRHPALSRERRELPEPGKTAEQVETYLRALWEQLFSFSPIGIDDNFFELGGHSLLAAQMLAEVKRATGRTLPLATLIIAPTIARLAGVIVDESVPGAHPNLVPMRAGRGRPVFMLHSITGSVMECLTLAGTLPSERPVYGLQASGLDGDEAPQRRVEDMASAYIGQMRAVQPDGPYALVGYSFGGLVAFEIAQQLVAAGEKIELLCLLDTYVNERYLPLIPRLRFQSGVVGERVREFRSLSAHDRLGYLRDRAFGAADRIRLRLGIMARKPAPGAQGLPIALQQVRESMRVAMTTYRPRRYLGGPILYVRASIREEGQGDPLPAWVRVAKRGLLVKPVDGLHTDLIVEPNLATVANTLVRELAAA